MSETDSPKDFLPEAHEVAREWTDIADELRSIAEASPDESPENTLKELRELIRTLDARIDELEDENSDLRDDLDSRGGMEAPDTVVWHLHNNRLGEAIRALASEITDLRQMEYLYEREREERQ